MKKAIFIILVILLSIPAFYRMLKPGIYSVQDPHFFRLVEYDKCVGDLQIPCRWSPDAGFGYGEPVFNFYAQLPFLVGSIFHRLGFSFIYSFKLLFILSLVLSGISMFFLAKSFWKNSWAALLSSLVYMYAPYRAVDVWVRGALPEALSFVIFPLIFLFLKLFIESEKLKYLLYFSLSLFLLINTHNLSVLLLSPLVVVWILLKSYTKPKNIRYIVLASFFSIVLSSFYILPVIFESKFINIDSTTVGYFDYRGHFVSLYQIFLSRNWGYGASVFGIEDGLNLSIGHLQWVFALFVIVLFFIRVFAKTVESDSTDEANTRVKMPEGFEKPRAFSPRQFIFRENKEYTTYNTAHYKESTFFALAGFVVLFLAHERSIFVWKSLPLMKYIQFPWRFLGVASFCFALASGVLVTSLNKRIVPAVVTLCLFLLFVFNFSFFKEDIWYNFKDKDLTSGNNWKVQTTASVSDYWPIFAKELPTDFANDDPPGGKLVLKSVFKIIYDFQDPKSEEVAIPVNYFPGWTSEVNGVVSDASYNKHGRIILNVPVGVNRVELFFKNTPVRTLGNYVSLISFMLFCFLFLKYKNISLKKL